MGLYLRQIELENFKSFGGKLTIPLMEGYLAVTGPNGSGKSNISDAILFVLGPKSSKAIRAGKLTDLIFDGGKTKNKAEFTKVSLVFDNKDRMIPWDDDTVKLTRLVRLAQDGENYSSYFYVNDGKSSMTEFDNLLARARISAEGYNLVQQGDVTRIVQMGNLERRRILDSISGIASFDADLESANKEKTETEANIEKIQIIITELDKQLEQLEKDMVEARKYLEAQSKLDEAKAQMVHRQLENAMSEADGIREEQIKSQNEIETLKKKKQDLIDRVEQLTSSLRSKEKEIEEKAGPEYKEVKGKIDAAKVEKAREGARIEGFLEDIGEQNDKIESDREQLAETEKELQTCVNTMSDVQRNLGVKKEALEKANKALNELRKSISSAGGEINTLQEKLQDTELKIDTKGGELQQSEVRLAKAEAAKEAAEQNVASFEDQLQQADFEIKDAEWNLKEFKEKSGAVDMSTHTSKIMAARKKESELEKQETELNAAYTRLSAEYESLKTEKRVTESVRQSDGVSAILELRDKGTLKGVHGTVMELASVNKDYETALSIAAGGKMQAVIVENDQVADDAINFLKKNKLGRVTFLPLNQIKEGKPRARAIMIEKEVIGYAIDLIKFKEIYRAAFWYVLGDTMVVDTLGDARRLMGGVRLVTKAGELIDPAGAMTGGSINPNATFKFGAASESKLDAVGTELRSVAAALDTLRQSLRDVRMELRSFDDEMHKVSSASADVQGKIAGYEAQLGVLRGKKKKAAEDLDAEKGKLAEVHKELNAASQELKKLADQLEALKNLRTEIREKMVQIAPADLQEKIQTTQDNVFNVQTEVNDLTTEYASLDAERDGIESRKKTLLKDIKAAEDKIAARLSEKEAAEKTIDRLNIDLEGLRRIEEDFESKISDLRDARDKILEDKISTESERDNVSEKISTKAGIAAGLEAKIQITEGIVAQLKEEAAQLTVTVTLPVPSEEELRRTIKSCETVMSKIGSVNLRAIDDFDERKERHTRLSDDVGKMNVRIKELTMLMESINKEKKGLFMGVYDGVNANFREIYAELSNGGEAYMKLENEESPFEAGLVINAKPRHGKLLRLEALSGGEKSLTALAFIFAIQELQPSPLYVLDEVDMFLDSVNAEMVARRIKKSSLKAQFVQVSLRKVTLALADHLIGVTRQPSGISKIIIQPDLAEVSKYESESESKSKDEGEAENKSKDGN
ncbi:MAG: chromosome segregation protein SMC [Methanomassiliicoccaceae archaeon]|jgi:chromosome segregation protein|nr:chromosome segregation protein SMC [Methanomassiliicoccaceae archaeon]